MSCKKAINITGVVLVVGVVWVWGRKKLCNLWHNNRGTQWSELWDKTLWVGRGLRWETNVFLVTFHDRWENGDGAGQAVWNIRSPWLCWLFANV